jgi:Flp pilus assembly protein TadG
VNRGKHDRGAAVVEFALVVPILLMLVFGIIEFGRLYSIQTSITAAARAGARVMALDNNATTAKAAASSAAQPYTVTANQIVLAPAACPSPNTTNANVTVTINYPVNLLSGWFGTSITLKGTGVMRCNG